MTRSLALALPLWLLVAGTSAAETIPVLWTGFPTVGGATIELEVGDTIEWDVVVGHDLWEMPNQALYDACDFTGSTLLAIGPVVTQTTFDVPGVYHFGCGVGGGFHCSALNMKVTVVVSEGPPVAAVPSAWPPGVAATLALLGWLALRRRPQG